MIRFLGPLIIFICTGHAYAQTDPVVTAKRAVQMLEAAATQLSEVEKSSDRIAALTQTIRAYEEGLAALREGLRRVSVRERAITLVFEAKQDRLSRLLGVLQSIGRSHSPLLMMHPSGPIGTARSGMILSDVTPALQKEAAELKAQLEELSVIRALQEGATLQVEDAFQNMQTARSRLADAIADRATLPAMISTDTERMTELLASADTLQGFADSLAQLDIEQTANLTDFETAKGNLPLPVAGRPILGFDEPDAQGLSRPGMTLAVESHALVTAPWPATVRYSGPLLDQGQVLILEPGRGYLLILSGIDQSLVTTGQIMSQGDPLAIMGGNTSTADAFLNAASQGSGGFRQESLYIELREGNTPTNPADWFVAEKE